jgi:ABC-type xylose transport system substrate-binding protein
MLCFSGTGRWVLQPLIDKGQIQIVADQWVDNWEQEIALKKMEYPYRTKE